jgi:hypothetical protein
MQPQTQHTVIRDVGLTLTKILQEEVQEEYGDAVEVTNDLPTEEEATVLTGRKGGKGKDSKQTTGIISLYLYKIEKNTEFSPVAEEKLITEEDEKGNVFEYHQGTPVVLNLRYMLTAWAPSNAEEMELMGFAMRFFWDHPVIEKKDMAGTSIHSEDKPLIRLLEEFTIQEQRLLWNMLRRPFKVSVSYEIPVRLDSNKRIPFKRVRERVYDYKKLE